MTARYLLIAFLGLVLAACATPAGGSSAGSLAGVDPRLLPFAGEWIGEATATEASGERSLRNSYVAIEPDSEGGFALGWATLVAGDTEDPRLRKTLVQFRAAADGWTGAEAQRGAADTTYAARLDGAVLEVVATGTSGDGRPETQTYRRWLVSPFEMGLAYERRVDGRVIRTAAGSLLKAREAE